MLTFAERVPLLSGYADWFASLLFFLTSHTVDNDLRDDPQQCERCRALTAPLPRVGCQCSRYYSPMRHVHYGEAFTKAVALARHGEGRRSASGGDGATGRHRGVLGVLMCHFDFFLNVRIFHGAAFHLPWLPRRGQVIFSGGDLPVPRCFPVANDTLFRDDKSWFWFENAKELCRACVEKLGGSECCYGWADILYIPTPLMRVYGEYLAAFPKVHHEVAVPTAMRLLATRHNVTPRALSCNGGTIGRMHNERFAPIGQPRTAPGFCAHRLNLTHAGHRDLVSRMLHERWR